eukprot:GHVT01050161.1.p1 GENE.GHVT01050161.1~~GHVT01050161.1.p1  ORF type:complete len:391 (-),score=48.14 GHVT01050161.1:1205-2377(-)
MTGLSGSVRRLPGLELLRLRSPFVRPNFAWPGVGVAGNVWTVPLGGHFVKQYDNFCIKHCRTFTAPAAATGRGASSLGAENDREKLPANVGDSPAGAPSTGRRRGARVSAPRAAPSSLFAAYAPPGISSNFMEVVGRTALVKLRGASDLTGCEILGKCEFANPGGSVKDRPAVSIIQDAESKGLLRPGAENWVVEGSAGNTAIGLALAGNCKGYRIVCVLPDTQSEEKKEMMRICGCLLVEVPFAKVWHPDHFVTFSRRLAKKMDAVWGGQFDNLANRAAHYNSTGPELWEQCDGRLDGFVSSVGTGGTLTGVAAYLREQCPSVRIALADVPGAVLHRYYTTGKFKAVGSSITENIGQRLIYNLSVMHAHKPFEPQDVELGPADHLFPLV